MTRAEIETQILAWMRSAEREAAWPDRDEDRFERLALALYRTQYEACRPYAALCRSLDRTPDRVVRLLSHDRQFRGHAHSLNGDRRCSSAGS